MVRFLLMPGYSNMLRSPALLPLLAVYGCSAETGAPPADETTISVDIGVPAGDGLDFAHLEVGGELRLQTFGQGGTHVLLAVRTVGFGNRAFVSITLRNLESETEVTAPAPVRPQLFLCDDDNVCDLVPLLVMTAGLTETDAERDGLVIEVRADVHDAAGVSAQASREARLSTEESLTSWKPENFSA